MRLQCVENGHTPERAVFLESVSQMIDGDAPSVVKTMLYRPELFGGRFSELVSESLRGESEWTPGERELFAGFVSLVNQCPF
jgi:hypothetical protein